MIQTVLTSHNLNLILEKKLVSAPLNMEETKNLLLEKFIARSYQEGSLSNHVLQLLVHKANYSKNLTLAECTIINGRLYFRDYFYVSNYLELRFYLCQLYYDSSYSGHLETSNTYEQLHQNYYWPNIQDFVRKYVCHCNKC